MCVYVCGALVELIRESSMDEDDEDDVIHLDQEVDIDQLLAAAGVCV